MPWRIAVLVVRLIFVHLDLLNLIFSQIYKDYSIPVHHPYHRIKYDVVSEVWLHKVAKISLVYGKAAHIAMVLAHLRGFDGA